jgi:arsenite methyltransferase
MEEKEIKKVVRSRYGSIARNSSSCCGPSNTVTNPNSSCCGPTPTISNPQSSCCGSSSGPSISNLSKLVGYSDEEISSVPEGSNLGLGCGNPLAHASIKEGDIVLDLGSGAGFDSFLASKRVGKTGKVIGVDMTPDMVDKARENAIKGNIENVEFRLGEIEHLPVADNSVDLIISNCVINLVPNKEQVFQDAYRVLKPGGKLMISDIVLQKELPDYVKKSIDAYIGCVSGASLMDDYISKIKMAGFKEVKILSQISFPVDMILINPDIMEQVKQIGIPMDEVESIAKSVVSIKFEARK